MILVAKVSYWFLRFLYCRKDNPKSCSDILYQTPALDLISCTQGSINGKNEEKINNYTVIIQLYNNYTIIRIKI